MSRLATIPNAPITVTNLATGATEAREPGSYFGLGRVTALYVDGCNVNLEIAGYRWQFQCADVDTAQKHVRDLAIRAGR